MLMSLTQAEEKPFSLFEVGAKMVQAAGLLFSALYQRVIAAL